MFGFEGPVKPTPAEKLGATALKCNIYSLSSLWIAEYLHSEGILAPIIAEINSINYLNIIKNSPSHDKLLDLVFRKLTQKPVVEEV